MKIQTKFGPGDKVLTPISERIGTINCVTARQHGSDVVHRYQVAIDMPHLRANSYTTITVEFAERELLPAEC
jgi:hypothetical protein